MSPAKLAQEVSTLFSLPEVVLRINKILDSPNPRNSELEEVIINDPALTAKILKIVNSAYYGFPSQIDTVSRAITLIGLHALRNLAFTSAIVTRFDGIPAELVDMDVFWYHSITSAVLARLLAKHFKSDQVERFFIAGLLSRIGKLIFFMHYPTQSADILRLKEKGDEIMTAAEIDFFGFSHAELGAELLKQWKLPPTIWQLIAFQLDPFSTEKEFRIDACLLHVAVKIASSIEPCAKYDYDFEEFEPVINPEVLDYLRLTPDAILHFMDEAVFQAFDIMAIVRPAALIGGTTRASS